MMCVCITYCVAIPVMFQTKYHFMPVEHNIIWYVTMNTHAAGEQCHVLARHKHRVLIPKIIVYTTLTHYTV